MLSNQIKRIREQKGYSQERLAELSGLSLRTIQRVENGETQPHGDTLHRLTDALGVSMDDIIEWKKKEDKTYLTVVNFSALTFILFPLLGILLPLILWITKKDKIQKLNRIGKDLLNFQITWTIAFFACIAWSIFYLNDKINNVSTISPSLVTDTYSTLYIIVIALLSFNFLMIILNGILINKGGKVWYYPRINFIR